MSPGLSANNEIDPFSTEISHPVSPTKYRNYGVTDQSTMTLSHISFFVVYEFQVSHHCPRETGLGTRLRKLKRKRYLFYSQ